MILEPVGKLADVVDTILEISCEEARAKEIGIVDCRVGGVWAWGCCCCWGITILLGTPDIVQAEGPIVTFFPDNV